MHDSVLEFDLSSIALQRYFIFTDSLDIVVVYVVKSYLILRRKKSSLDVLLCLLQISSFHHDILETVIGQLEATDRGKTYVVCISDILYHKRLVIQNGACSEPLHHEFLIVDSFVIRDRELDDSGLDENESINLIFRLKDQVPCIVPLAVHIK